MGDLERIWTARHDDIAKLRAIAQRVVDDIDRSGYGTHRPDRWTPIFDVVDVDLLAHAVLLATEPGPA